MRMRSLAMTDELTGVPNRRAVLGILEPLLARSASCPVSVLIVDIDHFKSINDQHGHAEGDEALKLVAAKLRDTVGKLGFVGRMGGEEFIAVLPDSNCERAVEIAEQVRTAIMQIDSLRWLTDRRITVSIGVAAAEQAAETSSSMLQRADAALYDAKRGGRNCVRTLNPALTQAPSVSETNPPVLDTGSVEYA